eukprot:scaffold90582_cov66-Phaeocystis_antarctica.AAC.1
MAVRVSRWVLFSLNSEPLCSTIFSSSSMSSFDRLADIRLDREYNPWRLLTSMSSSRRTCRACRRGKRAAGRASRSTRRRPSSRNLHKRFVHRRLPHVLVDARLEPRLQ